LRRQAAALHINPASHDVTDDKAQSFASAGFKNFFNILMQIDDYQFFYWALSVYKRQRSSGDPLIGFTNRTLE